MLRGLMCVQLFLPECEVVGLYHVQSSERGNMMSSVTTTVTVQGPVADVQQRGRFLAPSLDHKLAQRLRTRADNLVSDCLLLA